MTEQTIQNIQLNQSEIEHITFKLLQVQQQKNKATVHKN
jgi:hypothetical protein